MIRTKTRFVFICQLMFIICDFRDIYQLCKYRLTDQSQSEDAAAGFLYLYINTHLSHCNILRSVCLIDHWSLHFMHLNLWPNLRWWTPFSFCSQQRSRANMRIKQWLYARAIYFIVTERCLPTNQSTGACALRHWAQTPTPSQMVNKIPLRTSHKREQKSTKHSFKFDSFDVLAHASSSPKPITLSLSCEWVCVSRRCRYHFFFRCCCCRCSVSMAWRLSGPTVSLFSDFKNDAYKNPNTLFYMFTWKVAVKLSRCVRCDRWSI